MTVSEIASKSGYSRQRLNRLVDLGFARGIERKTNGRLAITDEAFAARWCEFLRRRKTERIRRNTDRKEKRDRLKIRRMLSPKLLPPIVDQFRRGIAKHLGDALTQDLQREFKGDKELFKDLAEEFAQTKSREFAESKIQPIGFYRAAFILRGRRPETQMAREALFDFSLSPAAVPWIKSFSDIAREYGCTRAAVSAMAKELPMEIPEKSGRYRRA